MRTVDPAKAAAAKWPPDLSVTTKAWATTGLFLLWLMPSAGFLEKFLGPWGAFAASAVAFVLIGLVIRWLGRPVGGPELPKHALLMIGGLLVLLFAILFPIARSGLLGPGSDRADALNVTVHALLAHRQPYHVVTYLGNPPTPMPGAIFLALPFVLIGSAALQNLLWLPLFVALAPRMIGDRRAACAFLLVCVVFCPCALQDFVTGGDYLVGCVYVMISVTVVLWSAAKQPGYRFLSYLLFALCISSRPTYIIEVPIVAATLSQASKRGVEFLVAFALLAGFINGPLFLNDPSAFPPFALSRKLDAFPPSFHAALFVPALGVVISLTGLVIRMSKTRVFLLSAISMVPMFVPVLVYVVAARGWSSDVLITGSYSLPITVYGGLWIFAQLRPPASL